MGRRELLFFEKLTAQPLQQYRLGVKVNRSKEARSEFPIEGQYTSSTRRTTVGRKSMTGGVAPAGPDRIQFTFKFEGVRYRPTLLIVPSEANLRRARQQLARIRQSIARGTFSFAEEFPEFRYLEQVPSEGSPRTCNEVFDAFLAHCQARLDKNDLASVTVASYRRVLNSAWRPWIGSTRFLSVQYSTLVEIADRARWSKKTYNNAVSVLRRAFKFGYRDHPDKANPTVGLASVRMRKKDRPVIDPFTIQDAEQLIAAVHTDWGEAQGNYDELRFFTGLRPSEEIALTVADFDASAGTLRINKARVAGLDKDCTKTGEDRVITLCPRAIAVLQRQLALRAVLVRAGKIRHDHLFFKANGEPIRNLQYPYVRWVKTFAGVRTVRYRKPYCARHSSVSWDLVVGHSPLWVAKQHGHSITTMLRVYAAWAEGMVETDIAAIKQAMTTRPAATMQATAARSTPFASEPVDLPAASAPRVQVPDCQGITWRRERDSNPRRAFDPYTLSRGAPSTTRPSLRVGQKPFTFKDLKVYTACEGLQRGRP
jgi:integrase